ncbi:MAG: DEAD/DEAH box helicase [Candidatus Omnitrophota bacterium]
MPFDLLSYPVKRYIREKKWESFRPIQAAAITRIITTRDHYILASKTASGKTEAAFLPALSLVKKEPGVQILYVSPLIALINDQFRRIDELCRHMAIAITRWHGDVNRTLKKKLLDAPDGILLITPESIESLFINHPADIPRLFSNLKFIIIDEIHSFLGTGRGCQLQSLLHRITRVGRSIRFIGLSATLGDFEAARGFFGEQEKTHILVDRSRHEVCAHFKYVESRGDELPEALIKDLYMETQNRKSLIFPNTRGRVEEIAIRLKELAKERNGDHVYFSHHSSVGRELREYVEHFARNNCGSDFSIVCTSTLEMGIDIGTVDRVIQVDSTYSISSLVHRFGRSGRKGGEKSRLLVYATEPWSLLQALACFALYQEGFIEPVTGSGYPADILFHQILSLLKETSGEDRGGLLKRISGNYAFASVPSRDREQLIDFMIGAEYIDVLGKELILGLKGEQIVNSRSFYSVFKTEPSLKVYVKDQYIGELIFSPQLQIDRNIFLAARIWKIIEIRYSQNKIYVEPAHAGEKPLFFGTGGHVHGRVREKMLDMLTDEFLIDTRVCSNGVLNATLDLRNAFAAIPINDSVHERPVFSRGNRVDLFTFAGTRINKTLNLLFKSLFGEKYDYDENRSCFDLPVSVESMATLLMELKERLPNFEEILNDMLAQNERFFLFTKWGEYLPVLFKRQMLIQNEFDIPGTARFLDGLVFKTG